MKAEHRFIWDPEDITIEAPAPTNPSEYAADPASRKPNNLEIYVDFAQLNSDLDELEADALKSLIPLIELLQNKLLSGIKEVSFTGLSSIPEALPGSKKVRNAFLAFLFEAQKRGIESTRGELTRADIPLTFQDHPNYQIAAAAKLLRAKADFFITGLNKELTQKGRQILVKGIQTGALLTEVQAQLKKAFEPYVGNPRKVKDGAVVTPHRLETIIRTNATASYNQGRILEARKAGPYVSHFEYSAVLDSRTTPVCRHLDGRIIPANSPDLDRLAPPRHYQCRSMLVPVTIDIEVDANDEITPAQIGKALELSQESFAESAEFYSPAQPRYPKGSPHGGEWAPSGVMSPGWQASAGGERVTPDTGYGTGPAPIAVSRGDQGRSGQLQNVEDVKPLEGGRKVLAPDKSLTIPPQQDLMQGNHATIDELYAHAKQTEPVFKANIEDFARSTYGRAIFTPPEYAEPGTTLKSKASALRKAQTELGGNHNKLVDINRATVEYPTVAGARHGAATFINTHRDSIVRVKDRYSEPAGGYRDILINYKAPNGHIAEVQFNASGINAVKFGTGHQLYERSREIKGRAALEGRKHLNFAEWSQVKDLDAQATQLYDDAFKSAGNGGGYAQKQ